MKKQKNFILLIIIIIALGVALAFTYEKYKEKIFYNKDNNETKNTIAVEENKKTSIFDKTNDRPIAVMIDNNIDAIPHAGLNSAYLVYEMIVEGGESRLMALFKGVNLEKIGPVRSSRHYFLDYALENDAIYVHYGFSPKAQADIKTLGINNINGLTDDDVFWRVKDKVSPHNAVTSTEKILKFAKEKGYRTTSDVSSILDYELEKDEVTLDENSNSIEANKITIPFSSSNKTSYQYNEETKKYVRYTKNKKETEWDNEEEDVAFKNIIIEFIKNEPLNDGENKDRQTLNTLGVKDGYYITNGKAIKIKCSKLSRSSKTEYLDEDGNRIKVNNDNTIIEICPIDANVTFE